jgi:hypothetical protein
MYTKQELETKLRMLVLAAMEVDDGLPVSCSHKQYDGLAVYPLVLQKRPSTHALLVAKVDGAAYVGHGMALCMEQDIFSTTIGQQIAMDKAIKNVVARVFGLEVDHAGANRQLKLLLKATGEALELWDGEPLE